MVLTLSIKTFGQLTADELYEILRARSAVFVMEQRILYQDMDEIDRRAIHVFLRRDASDVVAYARIFPGSGTDDVHMGRVLTTERGKGFGRRVVRAAVGAAVFRMKARRIVIDAQTSVTQFYERLGFRQVSGENIIEEIPHVKMILDNFECVFPETQRERIHRIVDMEDILNSLATALSARAGNLDDLRRLQGPAQRLFNYYGSSLWRSDMDADEAGLLPADLPRGVLSQDGVWNVMEHWNSLEKGAGSIADD